MVGRDDKVDDAGILRIFRDADERFLKTTTVQERAGYKTAKGVRGKLMKMADRGLIDYQNSSGYIWWITDNGRDYLDELEG